jgi:hypothetical protein
VSQVLQKQDFSCRRPAEKGLKVQNISPLILSNLFRVPSGIANPKIEKMVLQKGSVVPLSCVSLEANATGSDQ